MWKNVFAAVIGEQQIVMFVDDVRDARSVGLKVVINGIRLGLMTSLICKVSAGDVGGASYLFGDVLKLRL